MQSKKQKKNTVFAIGGGIVLAAFFLIAIIWVVEGAKTGTGQAAYILEKIGVESLETLHRFLVQTLVVAAAMLLAFFIQTCGFRPVVSKIAVSFVTVAANYVICKCHIFQKSASYIKASAIQQQKGEEIHE